MASVLHMLIVAIACFAGPALGLIGYAIARREDTPAALDGLAIAWLLVTIVGSYALGFASPPLLILPGVAGLAGGLFAGSALSVAHTQRRLRALRGRGRRLAAGAGTGSGPPLLPAKPPSDPET